jgi:flavin-dependent dehydrogenase
MTSDPSSYDVAILGGGLAGLTLALQLLRARPGMSVLVADKAPWPPPVAAHKVGESTVELGTHYLREVLGLADYLDTAHLPKLGLRFFFRTRIDAALSDRPELGARGELPVPSHQLDRGLLEAELARRVQAEGGTFWSGCRVASVAIDSEGHATTLRAGDGERSVRSRWVIDATGRASTLKRQLGLLEPSPHASNAVWFRVDHELDLETWDDEPTFRSRLPAGLRRLSTNHLMGPGYWVWLIPLSSGSTSIGIVTDPAFHDLKPMATLDGALEWLAREEPLAAQALVPLRDKVQDFLVLRHYSHGCKRVFDTHRWAVTGDAGAFLDPFYSPGTDFIALSNSYIADLVTRDLAGERVRSRINEYNRTYLEMFRAWLPIYDGMYATFGVGQVAALKVVWDFSTYWSFQVPTFVNEGFVDVPFMSRTRALWQEITELNRTLQANLLHWAHHEPDPCGLAPGFSGPMDMRFLVQLQEQMAEPLALDALGERLAEHIVTLRLLSAEITRRGAHRLYGMPLETPIDPLVFRLDEYARGVRAPGPAPVGSDPGIRADLERMWFADAAVGLLRPAALSPVTSPQPVAAP